MSRIAIKTGDDVRGARAFMGQIGELRRIREPGRRDREPAADLPERVGVPRRLVDEAVLPKRYLELCLVTVSLLKRYTYCVSHHAPKLAVQGLSEEGTAQLLDYQTYQTHPELHDVDRPVVEYAIAVTNSWDRTPDEIFVRLKQQFTGPQVVELTWHTVLRGAFNRFNDILQLDIEPGVIVREAAE